MRFEPASYQRMRQPEFTTGLFDCDDSSSVTLRTGSRFVRKLPDERVLGYLHKFYAPLSDGADAEILERLPNECIDFLKWANGAALFNNSIELFGFVETIVRDIRLEAATGISIAHENEAFALMERRRWEQGWTKIGSMVGWDSTYILQVNRDGRCAIVSDEIARTASSFGACMSSIIGRVSPCFTCDGIIDASYRDLETALASLVRLQ
jgi:hypothetical protein